MTFQHFAEELIRTGEAKDTFQIVFHNSYIGPKFTISAPGHMSVTFLFDDKGIATTGPAFEKETEKTP